MVIKITGFANDGRITSANTINIDNTLVKIEVDDHVIFETGQMGIPSENIEPYKCSMERMSEYQNLGEKRTKLVGECKSFDELFSLIDLIGDVQGSRELFTPQHLKDRIHYVQNGAAINYVTRTYGLREKVNELMQKDNYNKEKEILKTKALTDIYSELASLEIFNEAWLKNIVFRKND